MAHQERHLCLVCIRQRRNLLENRSNLQVSFISVLRSPEIPSILAGVLEKANKMRDFYEITSCREPRPKFNQGGEYDIPAVRGPMLLLRASVNPQEYGEGATPGNR